MKSLTTNLQSLIPGTPSPTRKIEFCHNIGLNYVSCSPFRVPIARLAAAHAVIKGN